MDVFCFCFLCCCFFEGGGLLSQCMLVKDEKREEMSLSKPVPSVRAELQRTFMLMKVIHTFSFMLRLFVSCLIGEMFTL